MMRIRNTARVSALLGLAFALALAGVASAFAVWGDTTYASWRDISVTMPGESPHGSYDTATQKCKVCHAVHNAAPDGEALLMSTVEDACTYCHVSTGVSDYIVYNGDVDNYSGTDFQNAHNAAYDTLGSGTSCVDCHSVHAATAHMTENEHLTEKILRSGDYDPNAGEPLFDDDKPVALSKWCTRCHVGETWSYYFTEYTIDPYDQQRLPGMTSHVMKSPSPYTISNGDVIDVAYSGSEHCSSCHASDYGTSRWPHYTAGARFLVSAGDASQTATRTPIGETKYDHVCLRCHRDGNGNGVGYHY